MPTTISGTSGVLGNSGAFIAGTAVSASGTSVDFTSIPSWAKRVTVMFNGVSTNGTSPVIIQIGAGSVSTSGYLASGVGTGPSSIGTADFTTGFPTSNVTAAADALYGQYAICLLASNAWTFSGAARRASTSSGSGCGAITLGGALDRVRITTVNGTDTFDAGTINILYE